VQQSNHSHTHTLSLFCSSGFTAEYIVYHELVYTTKEYMQTVTAVEPRWLAELGPMFFSIKESVTSRLDKRKRETLDKEIMEKEAELAKIQQQEAINNEEDLAQLHSSKKQKIVAPGVRDPGTPRRTPRHALI
jgi:pre-mRNA-splicing factor ATP-dependent RNA helicase DHX38/PRP16